MDAQEIAAARQGRIGASAVSTPRVVSVAMTTPASSTKLTSTSFPSVAAGRLVPMATSIGTPGGSPERPAVFFTGPEEFRAWLEANHATETELWMGLNKRHVPDRGLTWEQAVPEALCFGWIDSVSQRIDDDARRQRWTPRKTGSNWSAVNIALVEQLTAEGRMHPAGVAAFERRRDDRSGV